MTDRTFTLQPLTKTEIVELVAETGMLAYDTESDVLLVFDGVCWKRTDGQDEGCYITLPPGSSCPGMPVATDNDGNVYNTVLIGTQCWMAENLKYLTSVVGPGTGSYTAPYYYVYGYNGTDVTEAKATANYNTYGVLYNWPAAMAGSGSSSSNPSGVQGICPDGWHLPSDAEWTLLTDYLGGESVAGDKMREAGTSHWTSPNTATNASGFTALPGGSRSSYDNSFHGIGDDGLWWSATESSISSAFDRYLYYQDTDVYPSVIDKSNGVSVRCIRD